MGSYRKRFAFIVVATLLLAGTSARGMKLEDAIQPLLITFNRHDVHVIAFFTGHLEYEAVEVMVNRRAGQQPLLRVILTQHDGAQIDLYNDEAMALERAEVLTNRRTLYRPMRYEEEKHQGLPTVRLHFTSHQGEEVVLSYEANSPPTSEVSGLIDPGAHSGGASLPVMWANASAFASPNSGVTIDEVPYRLAPAPRPGALLAMYTEGFLIGVMRQGSLRLWQLWSPRHLAVGEKWLYWDSLRHLHAYELIGVDGDVLTLHKTTTSEFLQEELLTVQLVEGRFLLRSVQSTGRTGWQRSVPPAAEGFFLDLSVDGGFSLSLDGNAHLVKGTASREALCGERKTWTFQPLEPSWTTGRTVRASLSRLGRWYLLENTVGEP